MKKDQEDKKILKDWSVNEIQNEDNEFEDYDKELEYQYKRQNFGASRKNLNTKSSGFTNLLIKTGISNS